MSSSISIERAEIDGRAATVAYLKFTENGFQPGTSEDYELLKVVFDNGEIVYATPNKEEKK